MHDDIRIHTNSWFNIMYVRYGHLHQIRLDTLYPTIFREEWSPYRSRYLLRSGCTIITCHNKVLLGLEDVAKLAGLSVHGHPLTRSTIVDYSDMYDWIFSKELLHAKGNKYPSIDVVQFASTTCPTRWLRRMMMRRPVPKCIISLYASSAIVLLWHHLRGPPLLLANLVVVWLHQHIFLRCHDIVASFRPAYGHPIASDCISGFIGFFWAVGLYNTFDRRDCGCLGRSPLGSRWEWDQPVSIWRARWFRWSN